MREGLRIGQVAPLWTTVPPVTYGGTELIIHLLTEELIQRGHHVTLFACGGSRTAGKLQSVCDSALTDAMKTGKAYEYQHYASANLTSALRSADSFDVIHCHLGPAWIPSTALSRTPVLHTLHTALSLDDLWILRKYPEVPVAAISNFQVTDAVTVHSRDFHIVPHGCDFTAYQCSMKRGKYLAFLGRMGPHKSPLDAIRIAKAAGVQIVLAGEPQNAEEEDYFRNQVLPHIDGNNVVYIGGVDHSQKVDLLRNAIALLFPIQWAEPFGLVMIEAMACGTPVIAVETGSVAEVISFGRTGFYGSSVDALTDFVPRADQLDRMAVRESAIERFSHMRMVDNYIHLYESLAR